MRLLALDIGRKYIGVALSDRKLTEARSYKTFIVDP